MEKFAGYGFNKSHSAAYALLSYQTAYLKAHFPAAFMAAAMSADLDHTDRLVMLKDDCRKLGLDIRVPCVNRSAYRFSVDESGAILYGLGAIKGVGRGAVEAIIAEREANGDVRVTAGILPQGRSREGQSSGARGHDQVGRDGRLRPVAAPAPSGAAGGVKSADQEARARAAGQNDMFGLAEPAPAEETIEVTLEEWRERDRLINEKEALGLYLTGHPFDAVRRDARFLVDGSLGDIASEPPPQTSGGERNYAQPRREVTVAGLIMDIRKRGNRVTVVLDDDSGRLEVSLFSEAFQAFRHLLSKDEIVVVTGSLRFDDFIGGWQVNARRRATHRPCHRRLRRGT